MQKNLVARASVAIDAPVGDVWNALTDPLAIKEYMFGTTVTTDWREGSPISWKGEFKGKPYEDKGVIRRFEPKRSLEYTHFSPLSGKPDAPQNYHTVTIDLMREGDRTLVTLLQDNNETEQARGHSEDNWEKMLEGLKRVAESDGLVETGRPRLQF